MTPRQYAKAAKKHGGMRKTAEALGIKFHAARKLAHAAAEEGLLTLGTLNVGAGRRRCEDIKAEPPVATGRLKAPETPTLEPRARRGPTRYLLTCAQNNTHLWPGWTALQALAEHYNARIMVARSVYDKTAMASSLDKKLAVSGAAARRRDFWWDARIVPHLHDERAELAPGLVWCGETNVLPTAGNPLGGFETYTGRSSGVFPHQRIAMRSVASAKGEATKFNFTTGTVTQRNYIQRKAGQKAEFHHCYGALLVEVDRDGNWFCRQINGTSDGELWDLDVRVSPRGKVTTGNRVEAVTWGDVHVAYGDATAFALAWGKNGVMNTLRPRYQFLHDLIDFRARNGHNIKRGLYHHAFREFVRGFDSVEAEMADVAICLEKAMRPDCETVVVDSNHDNFFVEWITRLGDFRRDHVNAVYFLEAALHFWREAQNRDGTFPNMTRWALEREGPWTDPLQFLDEDEGFIICPDAHGGIECGMHGHLGPNGARGAPSNYTKMGRKANIGHHHTAGIYDGVYVAGLLGDFDQGYNSGPSSWSHTNIVTYPNGKRALLTFWNGKWRA